MKDLFEIIAKASASDMTLTEYMSANFSESEMNNLQSKSVSHISNIRTQNGMPAKRARTSSAFDKIYASKAEHLDDHHSSVRMQLESKREELHALKIGYVEAPTFQKEKITA